MPRYSTTPINLKRLTAGEQSALSLIIHHYSRHGKFPSVRTMAWAAGYSFQQASLYRRALASKSWLTLGPRGNIIKAVQPLQEYKTIGVDEPPVTP